MSTLPLFFIIIFFWYQVKKKKKSQRFTLWSTDEVKDPIHKNAHQD